MDIEKLQVLQSIIDDMNHEMTILQEELKKATRMVTPCRRARIITVNLGKLFKRFRKVSCETGLK